MKDASAGAAGCSEANAHMPDPEIVGRQLGPYKIAALLGVGGMGEVYRARDTKLGRDVAIKILPEGFTGDQVAPGPTGAGSAPARHPESSPCRCNLRAGGVRRHYSAGT